MIVERDSVRYVGPAMMTDAECIRYLRIDTLELAR